MGWIGKIFLVIIVLGALAILADIITWIYEVAWIIPIIIVIVVGFFVWRKSMLRKKMKIKQLVKAALVDGKLSDKEKQTILSKARKLGMDSGEAEIYLDAIIHKAKEKTQKRSSKK
jgi:purine-cytosine permease-like protein